MHPLHGRCARASMAVQGVHGAQGGAPPREPGLFSVLWVSEEALRTPEGPIHRRRPADAAFGLEGGGQKGAPAGRDGAPACHTGAPWGGYA